MLGFNSAERAYLGPFVVFLGLIFFGQLISGLFEGQAAWPIAQPQYWVYPLQTIVCGWLLYRGWRHYELHWPRGLAWGVSIGIAVLILWIAPQQWLGFAPRVEGFDPWYFSSPSANWAGLMVRFLRLVVVVPLVEEIFWRGFLLRWVINPDFTRVPFGTFQWKAFAVTTVGFCLEHQVSDWAAAALAGMLYNVVAFRTKSLATCVVAHAVTNLLLGFWVLWTRQWGFW